MKSTLTSLLVGLLVLPYLATAQNNYIANKSNAIDPGKDNTLVGSEAGNSSMLAYYNTFIGVRAGQSNTTGSNNAFVGKAAGLSNTTGYDNAFIGGAAGANNTTGLFNSFVGSAAGINNTTGNANVFLGNQSGFYNSIGNNNTFTGSLAGYSNESGNYNVAVGIHASHSNKSGHYNVMAGDYAGYNNLVSNNVFVGSKAGFANTFGGQNTFIGNQAGYNTTTGSGNSFIGYEAGKNNTLGESNLFIGIRSGNSNLKGSMNVFMGGMAGYNNTTGNSNTFIGDQAGKGNNTGNFNVNLGFQSGLTNASGQFNAFLGSGADATVNNLENATAIGANAKVSQSNSIVLGSGANIGIGTSAPQTKLEVNSGTANVSGLRLSQLTSASTPVSLRTSKYLTVDEAGNVILGTDAASRGRQGVGEELWQKAGQYAQTTSTDGVVIGNVDKTPTGYKLYVQDGILTEKVKVAIKDTDEWSDYVFGSTYSLPPLAELEQYVTRNKHLPGIPSAEEVVKHGVDVGKMEAKLLEKIEELTLYIIAQQKELAALRQQVINSTKTRTH